MDDCAGNPGASPHGGRGVLGGLGGRTAPLGARWGPRPPPGVSRGGKAEGDLRGGGGASLGFPAYESRGPGNPSGMPGGAAGRRPESFSLARPPRGQPLGGRRVSSERVAVAVAARAGCGGAVAAYRPRHDGRVTAPLGRGVCAPSIPPRVPRAGSRWPRPMGGRRRASLVLGAGKCLSGRRREGRDGHGGLLQAAKAGSPRPVRRVPPRCERGAFG